MTWKRLIRFEDYEGKIHYGEPLINEINDLSKPKLQARLLIGPDIFTLRYSDDNAVDVKKILGPLTSADVPLVKCVGLNYAKHIKEAGRKPPPYPSIFIKPSTSVAGHNEDIPVTKIAQTDQMDYEGELTIVIGKTGKDIPKDKALEYVLGYTAGNDLTARKWQRDPAFAGGVPQWCFSKGFDKFAPLGPSLVSPTLVGAAANLSLKTTVNGELRQDSNSNDLIFGVSDIIAFISQGTTLERGTVIMTGSPAGVAMGMPTPKWLRHGDEVEITISEIGTLRNRILFE